MNDEHSSEITEKGLPCVDHEDCGSSDALAIYDDGHGYCFSCKRHFTKEQVGGGDAGARSDAPNRGEDRRGNTGGDLLPVKFQALAKRSLREETLRKYGYGVATFKGSAVQVAPYHDETGNVVAQKIRTPDKDFTILGDSKRVPSLLFGQHLWRHGGKRVVITEGEIDALSVCQAMGLSWPVVSVPNGAAGAKKAIKAQLEWLESYGEVVLWFDNDEPGRDAVEECAALLSPGKCKVVRVEDKDANAMLQDGRSKEIVNAVWEAKVYRPDGIIDGRDISVDDLMAAAATGIATQYVGLNKMTCGLRKGELVLFTAGTGIGKSTIVREIGHYFDQQHKLTIGNVFLEESYKKTAQGYIAMHRNVPLGKLRTNTELLTREEWEASRLATTANGRNYFYNHFGSLESENLLNKLRYFAVSLHADFILLDHISIIVSGQESSRDGERKDIDLLMTRLRSLIEQTGVGVIAIAHLAKADGKSHEEGGRVTLNDLRGSGTLKQIPDTIIALERDQQGEDPDESDVRVLKNREFGELGIACRVKYSRETGRLTEITDADLAF